MFSCFAIFKMSILNANLDPGPHSGWGSGVKLLMRIRTHTLQTRIRTYTLDEDPNSHSRWGSGNLHLRWATDSDSRLESGYIIPIWIRIQVPSEDRDPNLDPHCSREFRSQICILRIPRSALQLRIRIRTRGQSVDDSGKGKMWPRTKLMIFMVPKSV